ncbi:hypothetical protein GCM10011609_48890 [Lentzea pudingi]|uniref:Stress-response A/B barrel domain-containing protein n=1 Tax=Lentzea pudingi TaxID=1789439 RepID=A0ABQ2IB70_9PSEU|nr:Dabb family protein [Lentzea pudingi]GGN03970.1 hypothetical protein GCM10011609_48890 [Lentzea pudingi]
MIRHIVLFTFKPGCSWDDQRAVEAEWSTHQVGVHVPELVEWRAGRNVSTRDIACDFVAIGLLRDEADLHRYLTNDFHRRSAALWREISTWVIADVVEPVSSQPTVSSDHTA